MHTSCIDEIAGDETAMIPVAHGTADGRWWVTGPQVRAAHPEWDYLFDASASLWEPTKFPDGWRDDHDNGIADLLADADRMREENARGRGGDWLLASQWLTDAQAHTAVRAAQVLAGTPEPDPAPEPLTLTPLLPAAGGPTLHSENLARALRDAGAVLDGPAPEPLTLVARPGSAEPGGSEDGPADDGPAAA